MRISDEHRELLARVRPVNVPETPCNGCVADVDGNKITHTEDCPVSLDIEDVCDRDRAWFEVHPGTDFFYREIAWGEASQLVLVNDEVQSVLPPNIKLTAVGRVRVERVAEGVRVRHFDDIFFSAEDA